MSNVKFYSMFTILFLFTIFFQNSFAGGDVEDNIILTTIDELLQTHGIASKSRIEKGVRQVADLWVEEDGTNQDFKDFCKKNFISDPDLLDATFNRLQDNMEQIYGHNHEINRDLLMPTQLDMGAILPVDYLFAEYDPFAHIEADLFKTKIAFVVLLNFPFSTLEERLRDGQGWSRMEWAQTRLVQKFSSRVPAFVNQQVTKAYVQADDYISNYNIYMHQLQNDKKERLFPKGLKLITHWGLRDELKAQYANPDGLKRQKMITKVMERIITQDIPEIVIDNESVTWNPFSNEVYKNGQKIKANPEPLDRYQHLLDIFHAEQLADKYNPRLPSKIDRRFKKDREIPEEKVEQILVTLLTDPVAKQVADLVSSRLGRDLQPFDIWYNGFKGSGDFSEKELDKKVSEKYKSVAAFQADVPVILSNLGFSPEKAHYLAGKIVVDPSRGAGHAMGAMRREDNAHLRTRIPLGGMNYKGYNIAIHELGHNVEQVFSLNGIDQIMLAGVPNTAFTEAFAFVFQSRDLELLGLSKEDPRADDLKALANYWATCEIGAVGLVDMKVWHWMYDHPKATTQELRNAVLDISQNVWNDYFAPLFGIKDVIFLGVYSHMIDIGLYLPDYSLGHIISFQIEQYLKDKNLAIEMERMCKIGSVTPDAWMQEAVGSPVSIEPLLNATRKAVDRMN